MTNYIRFDWAMKRMLRDKANHEVIEGLLTSLLGEKVTIKEFLESEGNQKYEDDKFNRVDILAENDRDELLIIEIQNTRELAYFQRMLYGVSKAITDYMELGDKYDKVRKVYSINIVYFDLGQGEDYVYHGKTIFKGMHEPYDTLRLSRYQAQRFFGIVPKDKKESKPAGDIFPEYYVLRVDDFDKVAKTPLDEWIEFLKTGHISDTATAPGLDRARKCMQFDELSAADRRAYLRHMEAVRTQKSVLETSREEGRKEGREEGRKEGIENEKLETAKRLISMGLSVEQVSQGTGLNIAEVKKLIQ